MRVSASRLRRSRIILVAALGAALLVPACSRSSHKPVYSVRGRVLVQGTPAGHASVTFHPVGAAPGNPLPSAQTDDQGYFTLTSYAGNDGAPAGDYTVTVVWFRTAPARDQSEGESNGRNVLPPRYANPATSGLRATVNPGTNELPPFQVQPH
jgi:hypothetical protein